jgi:lipid II:glycine glycyltransferase (peptidoglycan interpeptide bridge formation enzyme)
MISIKEVLDSEQWNTFLEQHPRGHYLQSYEWGELYRYLGSRIYRLGAFDNERQVGAMMFVVAPVPIPLLGKYYNWIYCARGPAIENDNLDILDALLARVHEIAKVSHAVVCKLEPNVLEEEDKPWVDHLHTLGFQANRQSICGRRSWVLDVRPDEQKILAGFRKTWRYNIRLAEREGVEVREVKTDEDFDTYYRLMIITSQRDNFFLHSQDYHKEMYQRYAAKGDAAIFLAIYQGKAVAARMIIRFGDTCLDMFGASSNEDRGFPKTHIVQYRCFQWAKSRGCSFFDFRNIPETLNENEEMYGVYHYKKGFGGFSRLYMLTQDYIYQPLIYRLWNTLAEQNRALRRRKYQKKHQAKSTQLADSKEKRPLTGLTDTILKKVAVTYSLGVILCCILVSTLFSWFSFRFHWKRFELVIDACDSSRQNPF